MYVKKHNSDVMGYASNHVTVIEHGPIQIEILLDVCAAASHQLVGCKRNHRTNQGQNDGSLTVIIKDEDGLILMLDIDYGCMDMCVCVCLCVTFTVFIRLS